jgi:hypothetical protein
MPTDDTTGQTGANEPTALNENPEESKPTNGGGGQVLPIHEPAPPADNVDVFNDIVRLGLSATEIAPSEKVLSLLDVRKPKRDEFVRCNPEIAARINIYEDSEDRSVYLVGPTVLERMFELVQGGVKSVKLTLTANYGGGMFAWPVPIPADVRANAWHATAFHAAEEATKHWVRVVAGHGRYEVFRRTVNQGTTPTWPVEADDVEKMLRLAFSKVGGAELINNLDHPVILKLEGRG